MDCPRTKYDNAETVNKKMQRLPWFLIAACLVSPVGAGCAPPHRPIFETPANPPVWPPAPSPARLRYVGEIRGADDLKASRNLFESLGDIFAGQPAPRPFYGPRAVALAEQERYLWVADAGGRCVHQLDLEQRVYRKITRAGGKPLLSPVDVCLGPNRSVFLCDSENVAIYRFAADTGNYLGEIRLSEEFRRPGAVAYDFEAEELYVVDVGAHDIKVLDVNGRLRRVLGKRGRRPGEFNFPCDLILANGDVWVVDAGNQRVQRLSRTGEPRGAFGQIGNALGDMALPKAIALDPDGHIYVVDARFENIQVFDQSGRLLLVFGDEGSGPGEFWLPAGITFDSRHRLWVCDTYNSRVQVFDYLPESAKEIAADSIPNGTPEPSSAAGTIPPLPREKKP